MRIVLFVRLRRGRSTRAAASHQEQIRAGATPRHVPAKIVQVTEIPAPERQDGGTGRDRYPARPPWAT
jgi:acyl-coenzyme A synthetase/AMP-(fatty) acid ligase